MTQTDRDKLQQMLSRLKPEARASIIEKMSASVGFPSDVLISARQIHADLLRTECAGRSSVTYTEIPQSGPDIGPIVSAVISGTLLGIGELLGAFVGGIISELKKPVEFPPVSDTQRHYNHILRANRRVPERGASEPRRVETETTTTTRTTVYQ